MPRAKVLIVQGTADPNSRLISMTAIAADGVREAGGEVTLLHLAQTQLPVMSVSTPEQAELPAVRHVRETAMLADGFILLTPEYHGNMSGALKNWFDFLYGELAGKFAGFIAVTGGGGGDMSLTAMKNSFNWCHGFTLPYHAVAKPDDFRDDVLTSAKVIDRIHRIAHDVVRYAPVIRQTFEQARQDGSSHASGVAGVHASDTD